MMIRIIECECKRGLSGGINGRGGGKDRLLRGEVN
jgi:hypothetical protein